MVTAAPADNAAAAAGASATAVAFALLAPTPVSRLYKDVLGVVFDFLTFDELHGCMLVCQEWLAAVCNMCGLSSGKYVPLGVDRTALFSSRLSRHISLLEHTCKSMNDSSSQQLARIVAACPFLRVLHLTVESTTLAGGNEHGAFRCNEEPHHVQLPALLSCVNLRVHGDNAVTTSAANALIRVLGAHAQLRRLHFSFDTEVPAHVSFAALQQAKKLGSIFISRRQHQHAAPLTLSQIAELRLLTVSIFDLVPCAADELLVFLQLPGPPLQWRELPYTDRVINDAVGALLPALPNITELLPAHFQWEHISSLAFLPRMQQLNTLQVDMSELSSDVLTHQRVSTALAALDEPMPCLTYLELHYVQLSTPQLRALLTLTPQLESLILYRMDSLCDLSLLKCVQATLCWLTIGFCTHEDFTAAQLLQLRKLKLSSLSLFSSLCEPLDGMSLALLQPTSLLLPSLQNFSYEPPE